MPVYPNTTYLSILDTDSSLADHDNRYPVHHHPFKYIEVNSLWIYYTKGSFKLLYNQKIWRGIKFGGLVVCLCNCQIKIFLLAYICMAIPYQTAKLKSANIFAMANWDPTVNISGYTVLPSLNLQLVNKINTCTRLAPPFS